MFCVAAVLPGSEHPERDSALRHGDLRFSTVDPRVAQVMRIGMNASSHNYRSRAGSATACRAALPTVCFALHAGPEHHCFSRSLGV